eukprot:890796-Amphidinium_carterae.1
MEPHANTRMLLEGDVVMNSKMDIIALLVQNGHCCTETIGKTLVLLVSKGQALAAGSSSSPGCQGEQSERQKYAPTFQVPLKLAVTSGKKPRNSSETCANSHH